MPFGLPKIEDVLLIGAALGFIGLGVAYGVEKNWRKDAEKAVVEQQNRYLKDANEQWGKVAEARNQFDEAVRDGIGKMRVLQDSITAGSAEFQKLVAADPGGKVLLTPAELAALRVLASRRAGQQAGGTNLRPANPSP